MNVSAVKTTRNNSVSAVKLTETFAGLGDRYFDKLKRARDKIVQVDAANGITETAGSMLDKSILIAQDLLNRHVKQGDRIVICSKMSLQLTPTMLGIWCIGAIACPIDSNMDSDDTVAFMSKLRPKVAFVDLRSQGYVELALRGSQTMNCDIIVFGPNTIYTAGTEKIFSEKPDKNFLPVKVLNTRLTPALIVASEGATRPSKLISISHYAVLSRCVSFDLRVGKRIERVLSFHAFATYANMVTTCSALEDGIVKIIPGPFSEKYACRLIFDLKVDLAIFGTNIALKLAAYIKSTKDFNLSCLKGIVAGLMVTNAKEIAVIKVAFPHSIIMNLYGCMECGYISGGAAPLRTELLPDTLAKQMERLASVGRPFNKVKYKVTDLKTGELVQQDSWGELLVGGPALMLGYYGDQIATQKAFQKGYFRTGDIVQYDEEEFFYIKGRIDDQIIMNGCSYPARELEEIITMHPKVEAVAVVSEAGGSTAYVVLNDQKEKLKPEELIAFVAEYTPEFKRLAVVHFVETLPKTIYGKVQKYKLESSKILELAHSSCSVIQNLSDSSL